ncbi:MAG TPA: energy transducer TonB [Bryobacteraceae bacterium]|nr:energy transducer TonB [Bryobacteraceae bacterium]
MVAPKYTPEAKAAGIQGIVRLSVEVDAQGRASSVTLLKSLDPGLDKNAIEAVKQWKWAPTIKDGKAVPVMTEVDINFSLQK